jgi:dimethylamine monooxygenase subunit A
MPDGAMQPSALLPRHAPYADRPAEFRIGLAPIPVEQWFEGGETDPAPRKDALLAAEPGVVWRETPDSRVAQAEALAMISAWLGRPAPSGDDPPLLAAARLVDDDLCLMEKREGGWTLTAASLCASTFFTAGQAVGKTMHDLHTPVTGFGERLLPRVTRIFDALQPDTILERSNWTVINSDALFLPDPAPIRAALAQIEPEHAANQLFVRMERQTIRKLPDTGAVLFTIRIWRHRLGDLAQDPSRLAAFAQAWTAVMEEAGEPFRTYKRLDLYDGLVRAFLRAHSFAA